MTLGKHSKHFSLLAKILLMLLAFWIISHGIDQDELLAILKSQDRLVFIEACILIMLQTMLGAIRWRYILSGLTAGKPGMGFWNGFKNFYISVFFNCCLPGTVGGDVIRVFLVKSEHTPLPLAISSVVIDRMVALLALGVLGGVTLPLLVGYMDISGWILFPVFMLFAAFGLWVLLNLDRIVSAIPFLKTLHWLEHLLGNIRLTLQSPKPALMSLLFGVASHISFCLAAYVLAGSVGTPLSLAATLTLLPWVLLIAIIPISIGGWGLREAAMIFMLGLVGVPQAAALTISVQLGLLTILTSLPGGLLWFINKKQVHLEK